MKTKEDAYYFIAEPSFSPLKRDGEQNYIVRYLYCDSVYMVAYLAKKKDRYEVHYPTIEEDNGDKCEREHVEFRRERISYNVLTPYFNYFKSANHAKDVEKEIKLAFRRWLKHREKNDG